MHERNQLISRILFFSPRQPIALSVFQGVVGYRSSLRNPSSLMNMRTIPSSRDERPRDPRPSGLYTFPTLHPLAPRIPFRETNMGLRHVNWCNRPLRSTRLVRLSLTHATTIQLVSKYRNRGNFNQCETGFKI